MIDRRKELNAAQKAALKKINWKSIGKKAWSIRG